ncbi:hypothetical protein FRB93_011302 [Tulasnella sp. JGI-2019a]|nr:hypothetical protein FRB93_011302 [Tulasnella sp. JGI-2019a]
MASLIRPILERFQKSGADYELLPTNATTGSARSQSDPSADAPPPWVQLYCSRPAKRVGALVIAVVIGLTIFSKWQHYEWEMIEDELLPNYEDVWEFERRLPQHNLDLPWPEGKDGRYVLFEVPYHHIGFNNQLQDILMSAEIAYLSNRAYAFQPYLWDIQTKESTVIDVIDGVTLRSAIIPLNAFLSGPAAGGSMPTPTDPTETRRPRAVSWKWFDQVCPHDRRKVVNVDAVRRARGISEDDKPSGRAILEAWGKELGEMSEPCVVVTGDHVWTFDAFGERLLPAWSILQHAPILTNFQWSPLVKAIVERNMLRIGGKAAPKYEANATPKTISGVVAVHLRRGDFLEHCNKLAGWHTMYNSWNTFEGFPDRFPSHAEVGQMDDEARIKLYMEHCLPTVDQMVVRLRAVRAEWAEKHPEATTLKRVYVMTNAEKSYRNELREKLKEEGWEGVTMSMDLEVKKAEIEVEMTADMMIGQLAEVFIGNGFSSLTSNINLLRMLRGVPQDSVRFL